MSGFRATAHYIPATSPTPLSLDINQSSWKAPDWSTAALLALIQWFHQAELSLLANSGLVTLSSKHFFLVPQELTNEIDTSGTSPRPRCSKLTTH